MTDITVLEGNYEQFTTTTKNISKGIANSVSMLQLDEVQDVIASAVIEIERTTNKSHKSAFARIPIFGKYLDKAREKASEEMIKSGSMVDTVDRLFEALNAKKQNIMTVAETLYDLKGQLELEVDTLAEQEVQINFLVDNGDESMETLRARNLLVQVSPAIMGNRDRIGIISATIQAASAATQKISAMLPRLQGDLIAEMSIRAGLEELGEFKAMFEATTEVVENLAHENQEKMEQTLLDTVDLVVHTKSGKELARLDNMQARRQKITQDIHVKLANAKKEQKKQIETITSAREAQTDNLLGFGPGAE